MKKLFLFALSFFCILIISGCLFESVAPLSRKRITPYGAYFVKSEMTRESRLQDVVSCGSIRGLNLDFDREKIKEIEINGEKKSSGFFVLREKFDECMKLKGYSIFPQCDERCLDP